MTGPSRAFEPSADVSALVLCGGCGSRMGGIDKGLTELAGRPLVRHVTDRLAPQVDDRIVLNCNRNTDAYRALGYPCVADPAGHAGTGPLAGIAAGLSQIVTRYCLICPCDTPLIPHTLARRLLTSLQAEGGGIVVVHDGKRMQPLHCLLETGLREELQHFLQNGGGAVHAWLESRTAIQVDFADVPDAFRNLNTPQELLACEALLREAGVCSH